MITVSSETKYAMVDSILATIAYLFLRIQHSSDIAIGCIDLIVLVAVYLLILSAELLDQI
jgi:hypothetical protein